MFAQPSEYPVERRKGEPDRRGAATVLAEAVLLAALAVGALVRAVPVLSTGFPLHDGGLFLVMIQDLRDAGFVLPHTTTYNLDQIPFVYPPFALYLTAALNAIGFDLIVLIRFIPLLASIATIPVVYLIALHLSERRSIAAVSAIAFALAPRSYEWLVVGGGLTRAPGTLFALLAIWQGMRLIRQPSPGRIALTGILGGLTVLTHPEASLFCLVSLALLAVARGRNRQALGAMVVAAVIAAAVAAPWIWATAAQHGPGVLIGAANSRNTGLGATLRSLLFGQFTGATAFDVFLGLGFIGALLEVGRARYFVPIWVLAIPALVVAAGFTYAMVPWSILIAVAVVDVLLPAVARLTHGRRFGRPVLELGLLGAGVLASLATGYATTSPLHALGAENRTAMTWSATNLPDGAKVAVVTGLGWWNDATSEWFPAIARRVSVATPQGYEWTAKFARRQEIYRVLQDTCAVRLAECVLRWADKYGVAVDYVYVPKGKLAGLASDVDCCPALRESLRRSYPVVYDGAGATIVRIE